MRTCTTLLAVATLCGAQAQQIDAYRYWYDDNTANAVTTTVGTSDELMLTTAWPAPGLASGYHRVTVQVRDTNGDWSAPLTKMFARVNHEVIGYRYWVNDNTATIATGSVGPGTEVNLNTLIDPGSLPNNYNRVTIQFNNADGEWSVPYTSAFVKNAGEVDGYEWWIDDAIAGLTSGTIGPNMMVDLIADLPSGVPAGTHTFTIRFSGANGAWSVPLTSAFDSFVGIPELPGITEMLLFPNPVNDRLSIRLRSDALHELDLTIHDAEGRQVQETSRWSINGTGIQHFDVSQLAAGVYSLRIVEDGHAATFRFVKQ